MGKNPLLIDCRFHTARNLPNMPKEVPISLSAGLVKGKIYVSRTRQDTAVCNCDTFCKNVVTWESTTDVEVCNCDRFCKSAVTWDNKVYFRCFGYDPKNDKWETHEILNSMWWYGNGCVMEGVMYCYSRALNKLFAYDFKERSWKVVKGVEGLMGVRTVWPRTVIYNTKVVVVFQRELAGTKSEIWCAVIKVEMDQKGEICGIVEWCGCGCVLDNGQWPHVINCSSVDV
ncbi:unnamed protein product [Arabis nemorensis]|uniref:FKB95-like N-terminal Kelch domain-containing protein n=1 Tax=Arabis nemorensis TaxID=586526 RepID=A0A565B6J8_9BRAS|nr:unnamed protein product [Arabis nemorensis]